MQSDAAKAAEAQKTREQQETAEQLENVRNLIAKPSDTTPAPAETAPAAGPVPVMQSTPTSTP